MFKLDTSPTYRYPVAVELLDADGKPAKAEFKIDFARLKQSEIDDLLKKSRDGDIDDNAVSHRVVKGWDGVQDADGQPLAFNAENLDALLDVVPVRPAVITAWIESLSGAKRKN